MKKMDMTDLEIIIHTYLGITKANTTESIKNIILSMPVVEKYKYIEYTKIYEDYIMNIDIENYENMNNIKLIEHIKKLSLEFIYRYGHTIDSLLFIRYKINENILNNNKTYKNYIIDSKSFQFKLLGYPIMDYQIFNTMIHEIVKDFQSDINFIYLTRTDMEREYVETNQITSHTEAKENLLNLINIKLNRKLKIQQLNKKANI